MSGLVNNSGRQLIDAQRIYEWRQKEAWYAFPSELWAQIAAWIQMMYGERSVENLLSAYSDENAALVKGVDAWRKRRFEGRLISPLLPRWGLPFVFSGLEENLQAIARKTLVEREHESNLANKDWHYANAVQIALSQGGHEAIEALDDINAAYINFGGGIRVLQDFLPTNNKFEWFQSLVDLIGIEALGRDDRLRTCELVKLKVLCINMLTSEELRDFRLVPVQIPRQQTVIRLRTFRYWGNIPKSLEGEAMFRLLKDFSLVPRLPWPISRVNDRPDISSEFTTAWSNVLSYKRRGVIQGTEQAFSVLVYAGYAPCGVEAAVNVVLRDSEFVAQKFATLLALTDPAVAETIASKTPDLLGVCHASDIPQDPCDQIYVAATFVKRLWIDRMPLKLIDVMVNDPVVLCGVLRQLVLQEATDRLIASFIEQYDLACPTTITKSFLGVACNHSDYLYQWAMANPPSQIDCRNCDKLWEPAPFAARPVEYNGIERYLSVLAHAQPMEDWSAWAQVEDLADAELYSASSVAGIPWATAALENRIGPDLLLESDDHSFSDYCLAVALGEAVEYEDEFAVEYLTWLGANMDFRYYTAESYIWSALEEAVEEGNVRILNLLLSKAQGARWDGPLSETPLGWAIHSGRADLVEVIKQHSCAGNIVFDWVEAAEYARSEGEEDIARCFEIEHTHEGLEPLDVQVSWQVPRELWQLLVDKSVVGFFELCAYHPESLNWDEVWAYIDLIPKETDDWRNANLDSIAAICERQNAVDVSNFGYFDWVIKEI